MNRQLFYTLMQGKGTLDYEIYLKTQALFACQKAPADCCNPDELQFQIVHQVQELWMKLLIYTLLEIDDHLQLKHTNQVLTLFKRVHTIQRAMIEELALLETMSPKTYQEIRLHLGNGSGQESPGFRTLLKMPTHLWDSFQTHYLDQLGLTIEQIYNSAYCHDGTYMVAEALVEFDELFQRFRYHHLQLIQRTIGLGALSLKGRSIKILENGLQMRFFPELWSIREQMTHTWSGCYGVAREALGSDSSITAAVSQSL
jgi:tryptophan 2,3-dioxygenase